MIEKIFSKTYYYLIVIGIVVFYFLQENKVLNFPAYINVALFLVAFVSFFIVAYKYDTRHKGDIAEYEEEIKRQKETNVFSAPFLNLIGIGMLAFTMLCIVKLPMLYYIEWSAKNSPLKVVKLPISKVKLRTSSTVYVDFNGEVEKLEGLEADKKKLGKQKLKEDYIVRLEYREAAFGTAVLDTYKLVKKK